MNLDSINDFSCELWCDYEIHQCAVNIETEIDL